MHVNEYCEHGKEENTTGRQLDIQLGIRMHFSNVSSGPEGPVIVMSILTYVIGHWSLIYLDLYVPRVNYISLLNF